MKGNICKIFDFGNILLVLAFIIQIKERSCEKEESEGLGMNNPKITSVVFLDVDGVLNTKNSCASSPSGAYVGIDEARILVLSKAMKETYVDGVVLTSTWKNMRNDSEDYLYLIGSLEKYGIKVLGKTIEERTSQRELGILNYLKEHAKIEDFVILDDQHYGFDGYRKLWESFLDTEGKGIENAVLASKRPSVQAMLFIDAIRKGEIKWQ